MKKVFTLILAFSIAFAFSASALAVTTPSGYKRLSTEDMEKLCTAINEKSDNFLCSYDKDQKALIMTYVDENPSDPEKSLMETVRKAETGDENAKNYLLLMEMIFDDQTDFVMGLFLDQKWYADVVLRCVDPTQNNALVLEYINGIRTSFRPQFYEAHAAEESTPVVSTEPVITDIGLEGKSYDDLVALKDQINLAIWQSDTWQEVEVPQGVWEVGADIPAGKWTIFPGASGNTYIKIGTEIKDGGSDVKSKASETIRNDKYKYYDASSDLTSWTYEFTVGEYVKVDDGPAIFTPYAGKPSLGFK